MKIYYGKIVTCDWNGSVVKYLVEDQGKVLYTGNHLPEVYTAGSEYIDLGGRAILPAFGDGHIHFSLWSLFNSTFDLRAAGSVEEIGAVIKGYTIKDPRAKIVIGFGHSPYTMDENRLVTRAELDRFVKELPVIVVCYHGRAAVLNSTAVGMLPRELRDLRGFDLESGYLCGNAFQQARQFILGRIPVSKMISSVLYGMDTAASFGVGLFHANEGAGFPGDRDVDLIRVLSKNTRLQFRLYFQTMEIDRVLKRDLPRIGGCFECALDGTFGSRDAALLEPYEGEDYDRGSLFYSDGALAEFVCRANRAGLQVQLHCTGDAAVTQAVRVLQEALEDYPRNDHRHTLINASLVPDEALEQVAEMGIGINVQPASLISPLEPPEYLEKILGDRVYQLLPVKKMLSTGINVSAGSGGPVNIPDPVLGLIGACNHFVPGQSAQVSDALSMYTYNIAHTSFDEGERGSLERGKSADMVVLNKNPLDCEPHRLQFLNVEKLILAGEEYTGSRTIPRAIIDSLMVRIPGP